jgi:serine/threonine-protein kinase
MPVQKSLSGQQIGRYQIEEQLMQKRVSDLYVAHDLDQDRAVFLEVLRPTVAEDADLADQFQRRMETVSGLEHSNIAPILDIGVTPTTNQAYAAIKYTPGPTLAQKLAELREEGASLTVFESLKLARRIADSLVPAHAAGIVHHDLRPANIIIKEGNVPILVDLGVPVVAAPAQPLAKQPIESLDYTPPGQWQSKELSDRSNIYSLGVILYELLAGHRPRLPASEWDIFERDSLPKEIPLEEAHPGFTAETYQLVRDCLWRQEWSRFDTMEQMTAAIDAAFAAEQRASEAVAPPSSRPRRPPIGSPRPRRRRGPRSPSIRRSSSTTAAGRTAPGCRSCRTA